MRIEWFYPGMRVKRWLLLALLGLLLVLTGAYLTARALVPAALVFAERALLSLSEGYPAWLLGAVFILAGAALALFGLRKAFRSVVGPLVPGGNTLVDAIFAHRYLENGPRVVVIGGGTGIPVLLRGLKEYTGNLTAVVTVADDGGSSGRLRGDLGILPPGDIRNCLVALAHREPLMEELLQYRFSSGELKGHNMGNLLLAALCAITGGFDRAVRGLSRVLAVRGRVLPVTLSHVCLCAEMEDGAVVRGESKIPDSGGKIKRVYLDPDSCHPNAEVLQAIREADAIVMGPGSLFTSILPNLLVPEIAGAIARSRAVRVYVCNVMTQPGETEDYSAARHLQALIDHAGKVVDYMIVNNEAIPARLLGRYRREGAAPVEADLEAVRRLGVLPVAGALVREGDLVRHHPDRLARMVMSLLSNRYPERVVFLNSYIKQKQASNSQDRVVL
ncbi:MAG: YvcK family protein [Firmicutes bacterium]|nr:YvcK family protein [Bacillota bacterium]